jgi:hypothetical protein
MPRGCQDRRRDRQEMRETDSLGVRCPGVIRSALPADEWTECVDCHAMGRIGDGVCARCNGEGWLYDGQSLAVEGRRDLQGGS